MRAKQAILIADDDEPLRQLIHSFLSQDYDVFLTADGRKAMDCYELQAERIAAVITDVRMPHVNGLELMEWLHRRRPHLPVILISGHVRRAEVEHLLLRQEVAWLEKPFSLKQLVTTLKRMLEAPGDDA